MIELETFWKSIWYLHRYGTQRWGNWVCRNRHTVREPRERNAQTIIGVELFVFDVAGAQFDGTISGFKLGESDELRQVQVWSFGGGAILPDSIRSFGYASCRWVYCYLNRLNDQFQYIRNFAYKNVMLAQKGKSAWRYIARKFLQLINGFV